MNSANDGPYGDAIMQELIPYLEQHFRMIREPWARVLLGGSTGGWESLALQLYHPEFFGGWFVGAVSRISRVNQSRYRYVPIE